VKSGDAYLVASATSVAAFTMIAATASGSRRQLHLSVT
jgi:hypothetical protein